MAENTITYTPAEIAMYQELKGNKPATIEVAAVIERLHRILKEPCEMAYKLTVELYNELEKMK